MRNLLLLVGTMTHVAAAVAGTATAPACACWCRGHTGAWPEKCRWVACANCPQCKAPPPPPPAPPSPPTNTSMVNVLVFGDSWGSFGAPLGCCLLPGPVDILFWWIIVKTRWSAGLRPLLPAGGRALVARDPGHVRPPRCASSCSFGSHRRHSGVSVGGRQPYR
eukprot:COSAG01_NODE_5480_length_4231_cov_10.097484_5_plen_164_part_00